MMPSPEMKIFPTFQDMLKVTVIMMKTAMGWNACWESSGSTLVMKMGGTQATSLRSKRICSDRAVFFCL